MARRSASKIETMQHSMQISTTVPSRAALLQPKRDQQVSGRTWPTVAEWILYVSISLCILDGAIRKWILRDVGGVFQYAPYFGKDAALIVLALFCRSTPTRSSSRDAIYPFLLLGLSLSILGALISVG